MSRIIAAVANRGSRRDSALRPGRHDQGGARAFRALGAAQSAWGVILLTAGPRLYSGLDERGPSDTDRLALTVLGSRHVATGLVQVLLPCHFQRLEIAVDLLHLGSMCALAAVDDRHRRPALVTGGTALASALTVWSLRRRSSATAL